VQAFPPYPSFKHPAKRRPLNDPASQEKERCSGPGGSDGPGIQAPALSRPRAWDPAVASTSLAADSRAHNGCGDKGSSAREQQPLVQQQQQPLGEGAPAALEGPTPPPAAPGDTSTSDPPSSTASSWASMLRSTAGAEEGKVTATSSARQRPPPRAQLSPEEELRRQAHLSKIDPATGKLHCLACNKALPSYLSLMQHLQAKHRGVNSISARYFDDDAEPGTGSGAARFAGPHRPGPRATLSLFDWMNTAPTPSMASSRPPAPSAPGISKWQQAPTALHRPGANPIAKTASVAPSAPLTTPHPPRREAISRTLQVSELGGAGVGLGGGAGTTGRLVLRGSRKKRPTTLKRIILRERSERLVASARCSVVAAEQRLTSLMAAAAALRAELDAEVEAARERRRQAGEDLAGVLLPEAYTRVQVLEVSVQKSDMALELAEQDVEQAKEAATKAEVTYRKAFKLPEPEEDLAGKGANGGGEGDEAEADGDVGERQEGQDHPQADSQAAAVAVAVSEAPPRPVNAPTPARRALLSVPGSLLRAFDMTAEPEDSDSSDDDAPLPGFENALSSWIANAPAATARLPYAPVMHASIAPTAPPPPPPPPPPHLHSRLMPAATLPQLQPGNTAPQVARLHQPSSLPSLPAPPSSIPGHVIERYTQHVERSSSSASSTPPSQQAAVPADAPRPSSRPSSQSAVASAFPAGHSLLTGPMGAHQADDDSSSDDEAFGGSSLGFEDTLSKWSQNAKAPLWQTAFARPSLAGGQGPASACASASAAPSTSPSASVSASAAQPPPASAPKAAPAAPPDSAGESQPGSSSSGGGICGNSGRGSEAATVHALAATAPDSSDSEDEAGGTYTDVLASWISNVSAKLGPIRCEASSQAAAGTATHDSASASSGSGCGSAQPCPRGLNGPFQQPAVARMVPSKLFLPWQAMTAVAASADPSAALGQQPLQNSSQPPTAPTHRHGPATTHPSCSSSLLPVEPPPQGVHVAAGAATGGGVSVTPVQAGSMAPSTAGPLHSAVPCPAAADAGGSSTAARGPPPPPAILKPVARTQAWGLPQQATDAASHRSQLTAGSARKPAGRQRVERAVDLPGKGDPPAAAVVVPGAAGASRAEYPAGGPGGAWNSLQSFREVVEGREAASSAVGGVSAATQPEDCTKDVGPKEDMQGAEKDEDSETDNKDGSTDQGGKRKKEPSRRPLPPLAEELGLAAPVPPPQAPQQTRQRSRPQELTCTICDVSFTVVENFREHCSGRRHVANVYQRAEELLLAAAPSQPPPPPPVGAGGEAGGAGGSATPLDTEDGMVKGADQLGNSILKRGVTYVGPDASTRDYCHQVISPELNAVTDQLLRQLRVFQERAIAKDPTKGRMRKRLLSGLREVAKAVKLKKAHSIVVVPNVETVTSEGGLDERLQRILNLASDNGIPVVFALSLKKLGQVFGQRKKMSAVALLDVNGADVLARLMLALAAAGQEEWAALQAVIAREANAATTTAAADATARTKADTAASSSADVGCGDSGGRAEGEEVGAPGPADCVDSGPALASEPHLGSGRTRGSCGAARVEGAGAGAGRSAIQLNPAASAFVPSWLH